ncbi:MAG: amidohydrolase family protein [Pseudomonadota bacterium]
MVSGEGTAMAFDTVIRNGKVFDGNGTEAVTTDIGIKDGVIAEIGKCEAQADRTIDAEGAIVTPGFIDLHTHYDGQISWDEELRPSVNFGVTTAIMGNCGVGFAPVRPHDHDRLVRLMEGVEDIPGTALHEGITWEWETFPEYMDAIDRVPHTIDFGVMATHDPIRVYVMGERAVAEEVATEDDIKAMRDCVRHAMDAGAAGFSIGRTDIHRTADGDWTPSSEATKEELAGLASALAGRKRGVLQGVSDFNLERPGNDFEKEFDVLESFIRAGGGRPASFSLMQRDFAPDQWKQILAQVDRLNNDGIDFRVQVAPRAIGVLNGLQCTFHPVMAQPEYIKIKDKPLTERIRIMRDPAFKARCLADDPVKLAGEGSSVPPIADAFIAGIGLVANKLYRLGTTPNYDQGMDGSLGAEARRDGVSVMEKLYDVLLEEDGKQFIYFPVYNYTEFNYDNVRTMLTHPKALFGLSDGGAHVGTICDASFPAHLLTYWTRDREEDRISVPRAIQMLTADAADYLSLEDRGRIKVGARADINVIDYDNLSYGAPEMVQDLPAGGQRLLQPTSGFRATLVAGRQVIDHDRVTDERPGRLVRFC